MTDMPTSLSKVFFYFIRKKPLALLIFFFTPIAIVLKTNVIPYALKMFIDKITEYQFHFNKSNIIGEISPALWLGGAAWFGFHIINRLQHLWEINVIPGFEADIRMSMLKHIMGHSYSYFSNKLTGDIANKIEDLTNSLESIRDALCWSVISTFAIVIISLLVMLTISPIFSLIIGIWTIIHLLLAYYLSKYINKLSQHNAEDKSDLKGVIIDTISNIFSVKIFACTSHNLSHIWKAQTKEKHSNSALIRGILIFHVLLDIPITIMIGLTSYFLIINWQKNIISSGDLIYVFNVTVAIMYNMMNLSQVLTKIFQEIGKAKQALILITDPFDIMDEPDAKPFMIKSGEISFKDVTFSYNKERYIFKNQNITIPSGQKVGIVGFSGSGKSTFINLILRLFELNSGIITIDRQDITKITQNTLRQKIAMIPQDINLFHRTILENIRYGRADATDDEVIEASKKAHCHEFIMDLQHKYNTIVGERGIKLSGGQRQRIAVARAMLKNAPILIMDEATSALDSMTEKYIQDSFNLLTRKRTTIVIAHRLSTLIKMDRIVVFKNGNIIEDGAHIELLNLKGCYYNMWEMQANGFLLDKEGP